MVVYRVTHKVLNTAEKKDYYRLLEIGIDYYNSHMVESLFSDETKRSLLSSGCAMFITRSM